MADRLLRTLRVRNEHRPGVLGRLATNIGAAGANLGDIRTVWLGPDHIVRDLDVLLDDLEALETVLEAVRRTADVELLEVIDDVHELHIDGKLEIRATHPVQSIHDLRRVYTPGVAEVVQTLVEKPDESYVFTTRGKSVAIVTNGTRVLGLGNVGPIASLPVMEGKAALLHQFIGISAWPILLAERDPDAIVETVKRFACGFGAIQLEDIESPACFHVEERLVAELEMPVLHDDQHGTAVAALAAVTNAMSRAGIDLSRARVGILGLGAAGTAIARMIQGAGERPVLGFDPNPDAQARLQKLGGEAVGSLDALMERANVVIAVSGRAGLIRPEHVRRGQGILALTNPYPEIEPAAALAAGAAFAADGRSVNNLLGYPGILRAALDTRARRITREMYVRAHDRVARRPERAGAQPAAPRRPPRRRARRGARRGGVRRGARRDAHRLHAGRAGAAHALAGAGLSRAGARGRASRAGRA
jgi:malate dehydrogenase (oxaloacetate-decarboxylating)